jgi:hypothetical protein
MKTLLPTIKGKRLQSNSTHIAYRVNNEIQIWVIGLTWVNDDNSVSLYKPELQWTIPANEEEDLFAIFERLNEDNRCNMAELNNELR